MKPLLILKQWFQYNRPFCFWTKFEICSIFTDYVIDYKISIYLYIYFFFFISPTLADTLNQERKFNIYAKLSLVPKIKIMEISTLLNVENETFDYEFIINSKNIVEFINQIDGKGKVEGFINNLYQPTLHLQIYS